MSQKYLHYMCEHFFWNKDTLDGTAFEQEISMRAYAA